MIFLITVINVMKSFVVQAKKQVAKIIGRNLLEQFININIMLAEVRPAECNSLNSCPLEIKINSYINHYNQDESRSLLHILRMCGNFATHHKVNAKTETVYNSISKEDIFKFFITILKSSLGIKLNNVESIRIIPLYGDKKASIENDINFNLFPFYFSDNDIYYVNKCENDIFFCKKTIKTELAETEEDELVYIAPPDSTRETTIAQLKSFNEDKMSKLICYDMKGNNGECDFMLIKLNGADWSLSDINRISKLTINEKFELIIDLINTIEGLSQLKFQNDLFSIYHRNISPLTIVIRNNEPHLIFLSRAKLINTSNDGFRIKTSCYQGIDEFDMSEFSSNYQKDPFTHPGIKYKMKNKKRNVEKVSFSIEESLEIDIYSIIAIYKYLTKFDDLPFYNGEKKINLLHMLSYKEFKKDLKLSDVKKAINDEYLNHVTLRNRLIL